MIPDMVTNDARDVSYVSRIYESAYNAKPGHISP